MVSDRLREGRLAGVIDIQDAVLGHQGEELLLMIGHTRGERRNLPVQVGIALLAAKAEQVHPLRRHGRGNGLGNLVHHSLRRQVLRVGQFIDPVLNVPLGCNQAMTQQGRIARQERDRVAVVVDIVMVVVGMTGHDGANEAWAFT